MAATLKISARRLNMSLYPTSLSYGLKSGIFKPGGIGVGKDRPGPAGLSRCRFPPKPH
jgi:hypothetical protein